MWSLSIQQFLLELSSSPHHCIVRKRRVKWLPTANTPVCPALSLTNSLRSSRDSGSQLRLPAASNQLNCWFEGLKARVEGFRANPGKQGTDNLFSYESLGPLGPLRALYAHLLVYSLSGGPQGSFLRTRFTSQTLFDSLTRRCVKTWLILQPPQSPPDLHPP